MSVFGVGTRSFVARAVVVDRRVRSLFYRLERTMLSHSCNDPYTHRTMCDACEHEGWAAAMAAEADLARMEREEAEFAAWLAGDSYI